MAQTISQIAIPLGEIAAFCKRWQIVEFALFGSVLCAAFQVLLIFEAVLVRLSDDNHKTDR